MMDSRAVDCYRAKNRLSVRDVTTRMNRNVMLTEKETASPNITFGQYPFFSSLKVGKQIK